MIEKTLLAMSLGTGLEAHMAVSVVLATLLGGLLGLERSIAGKSAGMRTYALVSLGSCLFVVVGVIVSIVFSAQFSGINPLQLASSVIVGIGFIGSGLAVMRSGESHVELTTASGIWVVAGVGVACGFGLYLLAIVSTILAVAVFSLLLRLENVIRKKYPHEHA